MSERKKHDFQRVGRDERFIKGHPNYVVSRDGQIRNFHTGRVLRPWLNWAGYRCVGLDGVIHRVGRIVARAFLGEAECSGCHVDHVNCDRTDDRVANLMWLTPEDHHRRHAQPDPTFPLCKKRGRRKGRRAA